MNSARYRKILEDKLELFMHQHGATHFLQDGAPCHRSRIVSDWFMERPNITLINWPGNSPDLTPIENCWAWIKGQLENCGSTSILQLALGTQDGRLGIPAEPGQVDSEEAPGGDQEWRPCN